MERYEQLSVVGEGSYGLVIKCRHRETDQVVAVKKFVETEEDAAVRRMALREIRMLKRLRHENLVAMIEVFRHRRRFYLVFEYVDSTILDELERSEGGLGEDGSRERIYQVLRAVAYCHANRVIHRDVKPENVLVSARGVVKLCDFGFARVVSGANGEPCTEYVATRWYRAPELLVGEAAYGAPVDVWAVGCLFAEMMTGSPMFPGESDIDQLYLITRMIGRPCQRHQQIMSRSSQLRTVLRSPSQAHGLRRRYPRWPAPALDFAASCVRMDPQSRPAAEDLLRHAYFTHDRFPQRFLPALRERVAAEYGGNPLLRRFKAEVLGAENGNRRRASHQEPRWRIGAAEANAKRKMSCEGAEVKKGVVLPQAAPRRAEPELAPLWLGGAARRREPGKGRSEEFSLPNLPGATASPQKTKKGSPASPVSVSEDQEAFHFQRLPSSTKPNGL